MQVGWLNLARALITDFELWIVNLNASDGLYFAADPRKVGMLVGFGRHLSTVKQALITKKIPDSQVLVAVFCVFGAYLGREVLASMETITDLLVGVLLRSATLFTGINGLASGK